MTPKEKAKELVEKFSYKAATMQEPTDFEYDKQCALICVEEMLNDLDDYMDSHYHNERYDYWQQVKKEIQNL